jgi:16S rRNA (guanine966-N2)-methyltransferase
MRIISGTYRGLPLKSSRGDALRPTSDQIRETLFDILGDDVAGASFLDAYAGSGAVGIEALSRGARHVTFLENHRPAVALIRQNLQSLNIVSGVRLLGMEAERGAKRIASEGAKFEFAFLDPPYDEVGEYHRFLRQLGRSSVLFPWSRVIAEHSRRTQLEDRYGSLVLARVLRRGNSQLAFYGLA